MSAAVIPVESRVFTRSLVVPGDRDAAYRRVHRGEYSVVTRGVLVDSRLWNAALPEERHRAAIRAIGELRPDGVFGGASAAVLWRRPWFGPEPAKPILISGNLAGGNSDRATTMMASRVPFEVEGLEGIRVTALPRSLIDVARRADPPVSIAMLDHALSGQRADEGWPASARVTRLDLTRELDRGTHVGRSRALAVIEFADGLSDSVGESRSRWLIARHGFPAPVLQQQFCDRTGSMWGDFTWAAERVIGEFDGAGKYLREEFTGGRDIADVVIAEKRREDRLRALGFRVARWGWRELEVPERLAIILEDAGLRRDRLVPPLRSRRRN